MDNEEKKEEATTADTVDNIATLSPDEKVNQLEQTVKNLEDEVQGLKDSKLRLLAEFDNFKRRTAKESVRMVEFANEGLIKTLLPVLENFERALDPTHKESDIDAFYKGVEMIYKGFYEALKKVGVEEVNPIGEEFDSEKHEAIMQVESADVPEHHIALVMQKGYKIGEKMVQYAKVAVSKGNT